MTLTVNKANIQIVIDTFIRLDKAPKFNPSDWLNAMIDPTVDELVLLIEGPKREAV